MVAARVALTEDVVASLKQSTDGHSFWEEYLEGPICLGAQRIFDSFGSTSGTISRIRP